MVVNLLRLERFPWLLSMFSRTTESMNALYTGTICPSWQKVSVKEEGGVGESSRKMLKKLLSFATKGVTDE